jgi:hypothetical protein
MARMSGCTLVPLGVDPRHLELHLYSPYQTSTLTLIVVRVDGRRKA